MLLEILGEEALIGEMETVAHILDGHTIRPQQGLGFEHDILVNPISSIFAAYEMDYARQIFGRHT